MLTKVWRGTVKAGKFIADDAHGYLLAYCGMEGKRVELVIARERKRKSPNQRKYYFGVIVHILANYFDGDTSKTGIESMHLSLRDMFLKEEFENGRPPKIKSTEDLSTVECETYHEEIRRWALVKHGVYIPLPNECEAL